MDVATALRTLLDQVDYTAGNCAPNAMVGAVLPAHVITLCRGALAAQASASPANTPSS